MSELCRCTWDHVWSMNTLEWLNLVCYRNDKNAKEREEIERWKKTH